MSALTDLQAAQASLTAAIASAVANPQPSYSIDGQSVDRNAYLASLTARLKEVNRLIVEIEGPYEDQTILW